MKSLRELYRIGTGPSSSHTMGPRNAAEKFLAKHPEAASFQVTLYGSLAATGKGHMTDVAILDTLQPHAPVLSLHHLPRMFLMVGEILDSSESLKRKIPRRRALSV